MQALRDARGAGQLERDPQGSQALWNQRQRQLYKHQWVVYAKAPLGGPAQVLEYLSRYTHRTAISNERIRCTTADKVAFHVRANDHGGKRREHLNGQEFVRRFLLHVLPTGLKRIRHYGVQASACKGVQLTAARQSLRMPLPSVQAMECAHDFMARVARIDAHLCPCCRVGRLHITAALRGGHTITATRLRRDASEPGPAMRARYSDGFASQPKWLRGSAVRRLGKSLGGRLPTRVHGVVSKGAAPNRHTLDCGCRQKLSHNSTKQVG